MALIKTVDTKDATGKVAEIYNHFTEQFGFVPNAFKLTSSSEFLLGQQVAAIGYYMQHPNLSFPFQAFVRMLVQTSLSGGGSESVAARHYVWLASRLEQWQSGGPSLSGQTSC